MPSVRQRAWYAVAACLVFVAAAALPELWKALDLSSHFPRPFGALLRSAAIVALIFAGAKAIHRLSARDTAGELGWLAPARPALLYALIATSPMLICFALTRPLSPELSLASLSITSLGAPFVEEVMFRAFLFRQLYRRARLGFWWSAAIPSLLFAAGHIYQAQSAGELIGILAITGIGGGLLCWVLVCWSDNFWAVFGLHLLMNLWWDLFAVDTTALGGWLANAARLATVVIALVLAERRRRATRRPALRAVA
jgi:membrane protease YdiL (CAAX protease family)